MNARARINAVELIMAMVAPRQISVVLETGKSAFSRRSPLRNRARGPLGKQKKDVIENG